MYKYICVEAETKGLLSEANHRELIDEYSKQGWRFVTAIASKFSGYGVVKKYDLIFEKEEQANESFEV